MRHSLSFSDDNVQAYEYIGSAYMTHDSRFIHDSGGGTDVFTRSHCNDHSQCSFAKAENVNLYIPIINSQTQTDLFISLQDLVGEKGIYLCIFS